MKLLIFSLLVTSTVFANSKIVEVTLFKDRASVKRRQTVKLAKGPASITFTDISALADPATVKVRLSDKKNVTVMGVRNQPTYSVKAQNPQVVALETQQRKIEKSREEIMRKVELLTHGNKNLTSLTDHYKDSFALNLHQNTWTRAQFQDFVGFLVKESGKLNGDWHKLYLAFDNASKELETVQAKLATLRTPNDKEQLSFVIDVIAETAGNREVEVQYLVKSGGWTPTYDLRIEKDGTSRLEQYAYAWQESGENWENVKLTLSNIQSELSPVPPTIEQYTLSFHEAEKVKTEIRSGQQDHQALTVGKGDESEDAQSGLAKNFVIPGTQTVKSNNARTKIFINGKTVSYEEHLELVADQYPHVFRKGALTNPFTWDLAAGSMNVFYNGAFQQQTWLDAVAKGDSFGVNAGVEHSLKVYYSHQDESEQKGIVSKSQQHTRKFSTTITNFSGKPRDIKVMKQIPVSEIDAVKVAIDSKKKYTTDEELEGWLAWSLKVPPKKSESVDVKVSVTTPADFAFSW